MSEPHLKPAVYNPEPPGDGLSEFNLSHLRKLVKQLHGASPSSGELNLAVKIIGHLNLARRGLLPLAFEQSLLNLQLHQYLRQVLRADTTLGAEGKNSAPIEVDRSDFCRTLTTPLLITEVDWPGEPTDLIRWLSPQLEKKEATLNLDAIAVDKLSTGWAQEMFGESTQVFTPAMISSHLAIEAIGKNLTAAGCAGSISLLDPACGAGHLLIAASERYLELTKMTATLKLHALFSTVITGLEIDRKLQQLCGFSMYLLARDQLTHTGDSLCELPLPRILVCKNLSGSLLLGTRAEKADDWLDLTGAEVNVVVEKFDAIVMNPPYLSTRIMGSEAAAFLKEHYSRSAGDFYTAFIELAVRLLKDNGRLAMIVQQSFLSVQRYREFRLDLLDQCHVASAFTLGMGAFSARPGEKVNSAILALIKKKQMAEMTAPEIEAQEISAAQSETENRTICVGRMDGSRLVATMIDEKTALQNVRVISGNPFAFDCPVEVVRFFKNMPALKNVEGVATVNGLFTCNNEKFVKAASAVDASEHHLYVPYDKGGGQKWYHETDYRLLWRENGEEIRDYRKERGQSRALPGEEFYFKPGLTYSYIGTTGFKARLLSTDSVFDIASSAIFSSEIDHHYLLGWLNSSLIIYLLGVLNPTINFQIGDIRRLPFAAPGEMQNRIIALSQAAVSLMRQWQQNKTFHKKSASRNLPANQIVATDSSLLEKLVQEEKLIQEAIDEIIFDLYEVDAKTRQLLTSNEWVVGSRKRLVK